MTPTTFELYSRGIKENPNKVKDLFSLKITRGTPDYPANTLWLAITEGVLLVIAIGICVAIFVKVLKYQKTLDA